MSDALDIQTPSWMVRCVPASLIRPPHNVRDEKFFRDLERKMGWHGWSGRPLVVAENTAKYPYRAWTGSHRLAAARERNIDIPCVVTPWSMRKCADRAKTLGLHYDGFPIGDCYAGLVRVLTRFELEEPAWWLAIALVREERRRSRIAQWKEGH